ncbi:hypothetical protein HZD82_22225, partial [Pantoea agglomerans]|nr:hypothetical protein [Pantoea agglomerans]
SQHVEHEGIANALRPLLAEHGVTLETREISYESWYQGEAETCMCNLTKS